MQRTKLALFSAAALMVLAACGGAGSRAEWAGTVRDSAGVPIVENPAGGRGGAGGAWGGIEELRIGAVEGEPEYQFGNIAGIDADSDGRIYVLDQHAQEIRVFDAEGKLLRTMGRAGSGPGELSPGAGPLFVVRGDTVLVPDFLLQRVNWFLGEEVGSFPLLMAEGMPVGWGTTPDGRVAHRLVRFPFPGQPQSDGPTETPIIAHRTDGSSDTLAMLPGSQSFRIRGGGLQVRLFEPEPVWDIAADGSIITAMSTDYSIAVRRPGGALVRVIRKPFERAPVTAEDREAFLKLFRDMWKQMGLSPEQIMFAEQSVSFADHYPAFARILAGPGNTIWVQQVKTAALAKELGASFNPQDSGAPRWDVFDADGRYLGVVEFPANFSLMTFEGDVVYGVMRDELEVQYVARLRVVRERAAA